MGTGFKSTQSLGEDSRVELASAVANGVGAEALATAEGETADLEDEPAAELQAAARIALIPSTRVQRRSMIGPKDRNDGEPRPLPNRV